jgi:hypothetical protein
VRPVGVLTAAGEVVLRRRYFWGRGCGGRCPSDERAGIAAATVSAGARELCCVTGLSSDFRAAAANLKRVGGLAVCPERLRQVVEREAAAVAAGRDAGRIAAAWSARGGGGGVVGGGGGGGLERGRLYVGVDGLLVRAVTGAEKDKRRKAHVARRRRRDQAGTGNLRPLPARRAGADQAFKEVKFGVFYDQPKDRRHLLATRGDGAELGRVLRLHAGQVGIDHARQRVALTDGAPWIARQLRANLPMLTAHVLDFYHLAQHVHAAANACLGEGTPAARDWAHARLGEAKRGGPGPVLAAVDALARAVRRSPAKREAARRLRGYVDERRGLTDYPRFRRRGWDVGSGPTEAGGKDLAARVRGVGMKWDLDHAADLMNLKALYESGQAKAYWDRQSEGACLN